MNLFDEIWQSFLENFGWILLILALSVILVAVIIIFSNMVVSADEVLVKVDDIVWAIGKAENSEKFPYGIKSIPTNGDKEYARRICKNSVRNNYKRWLKANKPKSFLNFMADRYCPKVSDPKGHSVWARNVAYWLNRKRGK